MYFVVQVAVGVIHRLDIHIQRNSGCCYAKHKILKSLYRMTLIVIHKYWSIACPDYFNIGTALTTFIPYYQLTSIYICTLLLSSILFTQS